MAVDESHGPQSADAGSPTLVVSMSTFRLPVSAEEDDDEDPPERSEWENLSFAGGLGERVRSSLVPVVPPPVPRHLTDLSHAELSAAMQQVRAAVAAGGRAVIHIVSHGYLYQDRAGELMIVAADSRGRDGITAMAVRDFLRSVELDGGEGRVLLLLDVCHAGAGIDWLREMPRISRRMFVIAACPPGTQAWNGRFSRAVSEVLEELAKGHSGIDPRERHVSLSWFKSAVYERVIDFCQQAKELDQEVVASPLEGLDTRFLQNPWYREDPSGTYELLHRWALTEFVDSVHSSLDLGHYVARASGRSASSSLDGSCHFSGREAELNTLADWAGEEADQGASLAVVTGSPGSGKSALLGVVVCCTHPELSKVLGTLVQRIPARVRPDARSAVAAVHARAMTLARAMDTIALQLAMPSPPEGWTAQGLVDAVAGLPVEPLIVVDGLDEAAESVRIAVELLLPLARSEYPGAARRRPCRLLVGVRPYWDTLGAVLEAAAAPGQLLIDLDAGDRDRLRRALSDYVDGLLGDTDAYRQRRRLRRDIAPAVVARITGDGSDTERGGEFLKAQLAAQLIGRKAPLEREDIDTAVAALPVTFASLLEEQLFEESETSWARPVLTALAFGRGNGMPADVILGAASAFHPTGAEPDWDTVQDVLTSMAFYLRRDVDPESGKTLYRFFHQELVDHLRETALLREGRR